ncbi:MarR family winged helix-turn-helix transcriptional regulator [Paraburkholderia dinghuensis]|uniref:MarR family transcriptional regulator n=1 Tax=Paraburkholderia dinghuensis TaxID=2305225 RepID=A0A3N6N4Q6_9BURK|nr:MarR family transcriptional regulator [Paraburkholderia dinghuensis]RQH03912.1 MarR family transcriptional regulator [Paraburkholderia dinghuensis]
MSKKGEPGKETAKLGDFMCFAIYSTNLAYSRVYKPVLERLGLTYPQYVTVICLWEEDNQTVKGLSEKLFLEPSTMTPMLKRLEAMGYVRRERDSEDERSVRVFLTEAGRALRERAFAFREVTAKAAGLAPEEFRALQKAIVNLRSNLIAASESVADVTESVVLPDE